ncbi:hypothetical protein MMC11_008600 [Xylographa trunciseda]|nr:hypothetical protein [Xylographa trunciseda]
MEGQRGFVPSTESETFQQTGFQPAEPPSSSGFTQGGFSPVKDDGSTGFHQTGFHQTGFQPTDTSASSGFTQSGFQPQETGFHPPPGQKTTISTEKFSEIEAAVKAAKEALDKVSSLIQDIAFTPQPSAGFN